MAETTRSGVRLIRQRPILLTLLSITAFSGLFSEGYDRLWTAHLLQDFSVPALGPFQPVVWFGVISAGSALLNLGVTEVIKRRLDSNRHRAVANLLLAFTAHLVRERLSRRAGADLPHMAGAAHRPGSASDGALD